MGELDPNSCRICLSITQTNERQDLHVEENVLSEVGLLYEEVLSLPICFVEPMLKYICNSCDLQLKLFKELKSKALETHLLLSDLNNLKDFNIIDNSLSDADMKTEILEQYEEEAETKIDCPNAIISNEDLIIPIEFNNDTDALEMYDTQYLDADKYLEESDEVQQVEYIIDTADVELESSTSSPRITKQYNVFPCCNCNKTFTVKSHLEKHQKKMHQKTKKIVCNLCPKVMFSEEALQVHLNLHKGLPAYQCSICEKPFKQKAHYNYHMLNHKNERNIICDICQKGFISKGDLKIHQRVHTDERPYKCDVCEKRFRAHTHMVNHRYSHFEKKFECPVCFQKYVSPNTLRTHYKSVHVGNVTYDCALCEKKFKRKHHLTTHYNTHKNAMEILTIENDELTTEFT